MLILSPIEQFAVYPVIYLSNISYQLLLVVLCYLFFRNSYLLRNHIGWWYPQFINLQSKVFILLTIWFIILFSNLTGMIPYSSTLTAQIVIVLSISLPTFLSLNLIAIPVHTYNIFYLILPAGAPLLLTPVITILELISYIMRTLSLTVRLVANLLSGHILLKILIYAVLSSPFLALLFIPIFILEILVCFIQSYVFILLIINYYQDTFIAH